MFERKQRASSNAAIQPKSFKSAHYIAAADSELEQLFNQQLSTFDASLSHVRLSPSLTDVVERERERSAASLTALAHHCVAQLHTVYCKTQEFVDKSSIDQAQRMSEYITEFLAACTKIHESVSRTREAYPVQLQQHLSCT